MLLIVTDQIILDSLQSGEYIGLISYSDVWFYWGGGGGLTASLKAVKMLQFLTLKTVFGTQLIIVVTLGNRS